MIGISMHSLERMGVVINDQETMLDRRDIETLAIAITSALKWDDQDFSNSRRGTSQEQHYWEQAGGDLDRYKILRRERRNA